MEGFSTWIPEKYQIALGWMILHALWQIAGIGLLLWLSQRLFQHKSAAFKYRLSISSLLVIAMASILTFSYYSGREAHATFSNEMMLTQHPDNSITLLSQAEKEVLILKDDPLDFVVLIQKLEKGLPTLVNIWLIGALLFMVRLGGGLADLRNLRNKPHQNPDPKWVCFLENQMRKLDLKTPVTLFQSIHVDVPIAYGMFKPIILIPASLVLQLSPAQLEAILTHELAHIKRHDYLFNLFQSFLEVVFFFHPVFWWINKIAREQRENACDDLAIQLDIVPKDLAYGLANVLNHARTTAPEIAMAAARANNPTLDRIKRIMGISSSPSQPSTTISITMVITLLLSATLLVGASEERAKASLEELIATELKTSTIEKEWTNSFSYLDANDTVSRTKKDSVPTKKWEEMTEKEQKKMGKELEQLEPLKSLNFIFKDLDFAFGDSLNLPPMVFHEIPMPNFNFENLPKFEFNDEQFRILLPDSAFFNSIPSIRFNMGDSTWKPFAFDGLDFQMDTSKKSKQEREQMMRELKEKLAAQSEQRKESLQKMQKEREAMLQGLAKKREEYQAQIQPQIKEYQAKIQEWQKQNEPMLQEYQAKMKVWQEENQPKMEEFQKQMDTWQKENQVQLKAFEKKMEEWQKNHQKELKGLQEKIEKNVKKELN